MLDPKKLNDAWDIVQLHNGRSEAVSVLARVRDLNLNDEELNALLERAKAQQTWAHAYTRAAIRMISGPVPWKSELLQYLAERLHRMESENDLAYLSVANKKLEELTRVRLTKGEIQSELRSIEVDEEDLPVVSSA
jgi:hypothetical protein